ncbi:hypothetical protein ACOME3_006756 [Neoechinorhynchus agilis]
MLGAFTVFGARLRIAFTSACRKYLPPDCRQTKPWRTDGSTVAPQRQRWDVHIGTPSLRGTGTLTVSSKRGVPTKAIRLALSKAPVSLVETAANGFRFTRSRESEIKEL